MEYNKSWSEVKPYKTRSKHTIIHRSKHCSTTCKRNKNQTGKSYKSSTKTELSLSLGDYTTSMNIYNYIYTTQFYSDNFQANNNEADFRKIYLRPNI